MTTARFVQIHTLHHYTGVLLNRDDSGAAKRIPLGGSLRTRISSQCLKRHWRVGSGPGMGLSSLGEESVRTRLVERRLEEFIGDSAKGVADENLKAALAGVAVVLYGKDAKDVKKRQALLFGESELRYLAKVTVDLAKSAPTAKEIEANASAFLKENKGNLAALREAVSVPGGITGAMFGRMVTADKAANLDAAVSVAHSFTVHAEESEGDIITVVDDLVRDDESGAGGMFDSEINSGTFYSYVVVDVAQLVANLTGTKQEDWNAEGVDRSLPAAAIQRLVETIATVSPGAKKGSTAPYGYAEAILVELGDALPRSLAGAFQSAVPLNRNRSVTDLAIERLSERLDRVDNVYGTGERRAFLALDKEAVLPGSRQDSLSALAAFAASAVGGAA